MAHAAHGLPRMCNGGLVASMQRRSLPKRVPMSTVTLHRVVRASPERIYRAFLQADAVAKWLPPNGFTCIVEHLHAHVGGTFRMAFTNFANGERHAFGATYRELQPNALLRYDDAFDDPSLPGTMVTTVQLHTLPCGTDLHVVQEGIPEQIPLHACYLGWQDSLMLLAHLVEAHPEQ
ncbi:ATPase [Xanthomonas citri pv. fuscans CFBP 6996]|uniref:SRPBCC family protein n=1 Tax=Xanthomonas citri TaxID=346 RepID=UPI000C183B3C|nr:SRPBCC family protein [Xanthomonas citri]ATS53419.1 SRPBCC family protein [Xanthomonas citri pv. phaseoli var. fuscans]ATS57702.1 SRPBCC family protein [Xanthomonas citri pv. phaseoli var. fuscans]ATS61839.1 SRPBCC family protein [Xanthomonas citri pv. phaseoli var. fuscans]PTY32450.1 ATPase [Xanthomonas citri pv. fuscans CFBP 6996]QWN18326.1 ATPase [Xanthomonas citri]